MVSREGSEAPLGFVVVQAEASMRASLDALLDRVETLQLHEYPSPVIPSILSALERSIRSIATRFEHRGATFGGSPLPMEGAASSRAKLRTIHRCSLALRDLHGFVLRLARMTQEQRPPWLGEMLGAIIRRHRPEADFGLLFEPQPAAVEYIYEEVRQDLDTWLDQFFPEGDRDPTLLSGLPKEILVLGYPAAEPQNVLLHPIFLHEVGHYVTHDLVCRVIDETADVPDMGIPPEDDDDLLAAAKEVDFRWCWEVASDMFAVRVAGPAYFFGLAHVFNLSANLNRFDKDHPPASYRLNVLLEILAGVSGAENTNHLAHLTGNLKPWLEQIRGMVEEELGLLPNELADKAEQTGYPYPALFARLQAREERMRELVIALTETDAYIADSPSLQVKDKLVAQLLTDIPANEYRVKDAVTGKDRAQPARLPDILNSGYEVLYNRDEELLARFTSANGHEANGENSGPVLQEARKRVRQLLVKSFELNHIQSEFARIRTIMGTKDERAVRGQASGTDGGGGAEEAAGGDAAPG
ncbi:MAG TPA: hypothetical protein VEQ60_17020 [Longimicrobium sp.]|nr:hypothetical protein [Longimicrobium sp.]